MISEANGHWQAAEPVAVALNKGGFAQVSQVSCGSPGNCSAVGSYDPGGSGSVPFALNLRNGTWGPLLKLPGVAKLDTGHFSFAGSVSCASPGDCTAEGAYFVAKTRDQSIFVATEHNWTWGGALVLPGIGALNTGRDASTGPVSCVSPGGGHQDQPGAVGGHDHVRARAGRAPVGPRRAAVRRGSRGHRHGHRGDDHRLRDQAQGGQGIVHALRRQAQGRQLPPDSRLPRR